MTTTAPTVSAEEMTKTLNRFDRIAIAKAFDATLEDLREQPFDFLASLAFVHLRRQGLNDPAARDAAFELTIGQLGDYFPADPADADDLDDDGPAGKDETPST